VNNQATLEKMHLMKFYGMLTFFKSLLEIGKTDLTVDEAIGNLIDAEWDERYNRKLKRTLNNAKFRYQASFEQMDFDANRNLNKNEFTRLVTCDWLKKGQSLIITGPTGSGKSYIACALGHQACKEGFKILYFKMFRR